MVPAMLLAFVGSTWANGVARVENSSSGKGFVYSSATQVNYADITDSQWNNSESKANIGSGAAGRPYYVYAKPMEGCTFVGWSRSNSANGTILSTSTEYQVTTEEALSQSNQNDIVYAIFSGEAAEQGNITIVNNNPEGGSVSVSPTSALPGTTVKITVTENSGYKMKSLRAEDADGNDVPITTTAVFIMTSRTFIMPNSAVTLYVDFGKAFNISFNNTGAGNTSANPASAAEGMTVTITPNPNKGYRLGTISAVDRRNNPITLTQALNADNDTVYTFVMPDTAVIISARYVQAPLTINFTEASKAKDGRYYASHYWQALAYIVPEGMRGETYKVVDGQLLVSQTYNPGDILPSNNGVILSTESPTPLAMEPSADKGTPDPDNMLLGSNSTKTENDSAYVYYILATAPADNPTAGAGFYWYSEGGYSVRSAAFKAYLKVPREAAAGSKGWEFGGNTTGINTINTNNNSVKTDKWYTIDGRQLNGMPTQRGLYINNGKKVVIK